MFCIVLKFILRVFEAQWEISRFFQLLSLKIRPEFGVSPPPKKTLITRPNIKAKLFIQAWPDSISTKYVHFLVTYLNIKILSPLTYA